MSRGERKKYNIVGEEAGGENKHSSSLEDKMRGEGDEQRYISRLMSDMFRCAPESILPPPFPDS
jgi:hypothetical protein